MGSALSELKRSQFEAAITPATSPRPSGTTSPDGLNPWLVITSELLGEDVLYVRDSKRLEAARTALPGMIAYAADEIDVLYAHRENPDLIRTIHQIKKKFGGRVRPLQNAAASTV